MERDDLGARKVDPYHLLFRGGQFYVLGARTSATRCASSACRASGQGRLRHEGRARLQAPQGLRPARVRQPRRLAVRRAIGTAEVWISDRIAWLVERHYGRFGSFAPAQDGVLFSTSYASARQLASWALSLGEHARVEGPAELVDVVAERVARLAELHEAEPLLAAAARVGAARAVPRRPRRGQRAPRGRHPPRALRAPGHARLDPHRGRPRGRAPARGGASASACRSPGPSCARTSTSSTS